MNRVTKRIFMSLLLVSGLVWAITPAGTVIRNQASVLLEDETYLSNEVDTLVQAVCIPELSPNGSASAPGQFASGTQDQTVYLPYSLTNAGNDRFEFTLTWAQEVSSAWTPAEVKFYKDLNNNAQKDAGEPELSALSLDAGESINLIMAVRLPLAVTGLGFITPVAECETGEIDQDNYAQINLTDGAALQIFKQVSLSKAKVGDILRFSIELLNSGNAPTSGDVVLTDLFTSSDFDGLRYQPSSAVASRGDLSFYDGTNWLATEVGEVKGLRVTATSLRVGELIRLVFDMEVLPGAKASQRNNIITATGDGGPAQVSIPFEILPTTSHHLGPKDNPRALAGGEASDDDKQTKASIIYGQPSCFEHSLENAGNSQDEYRIDITGVPEGITASLNTLAGEPLAEVLELTAGEVRNFLLCLTSAIVSSDFAVTLSATSETTGVVNITVDEVGKSVSGSDAALMKTADVEGVIDEDQVLTYTLRVENKNSFDLTNVVIEDELQLFQARDGSFSSTLLTRFISASDGGSYDAETRLVTWQFDRLAQGQVLELELKVKMPEESPKGEVFSLSNFFSLRAQELPNPLISNTVFHGFPVISISIDKSVTPTVTRVGEVLTYTIEIGNPNDVELALEVADKPDARLAYVPGSAEVTVDDYTVQLEPVVSSDKLTWEVRQDPQLILSPAGQGRDSLSLVYKMLVKPGAEGTLINTAQAFGFYDFSPPSTSGLDTQQSGLVIASLEVQAQVILLASNLSTEPPATLTGRVYFDVNEDDRYDHGVDLPLPGARIVLSNGWQVLSDTEGRYSFRELSPSTWSIMLDPVSAPFTLRPHPEALGEGYRHRVVLQGLTVSDFILEPPLGVIDAVRRTTLLFGPLRIEKQLIPLPEGTRVSLFVSSTEVLPELMITDTVPGQEDKIFNFESFEGEKSLSYDVPIQIPLTDPNARWRYP